MPVLAGIGHLNIYIYICREEEAGTICKDPLKGIGVWDLYRSCVFRDFDPKQSRIGR